MSAIESILNAGIFELMQGLDSDSGTLQAVTFWFYAEEEGDIYRLAHRLTVKKYNVWISYCDYDDTWQCIGEKMPAPQAKQLNRVNEAMADLAEKFGVQYEGWLHCGCLELDAGM